MTKQDVDIVWFKRDLRLNDHLPLWSAAQTGRGVIPLYVVEPEYWAQPFASRRHWCFIHDCLTDLQAVTRSLGQALVIRVGSVESVLQELTCDYRVHTIHAHEESGNMWTFERDKTVLRWVKNTGVNFQEYPCNGVVRHLQSRDHWSTIRNQRMAAPIIQVPERLASVSGIQSDPIPRKDDALFGDKLEGVVQKGGVNEARQILGSFLTHRSKHYIYRLSAPGPSERFCSRLSPHLTWGSLSVKEVVHALKARRQEVKRAMTATSNTGGLSRNLSAFGSRIAWRCHFIQKIEDQPAIEFECMHPAFEGMRESEFDEVRFQAWCQGKTGYPLIDACMRNLNHEGWLTFRMRAMLVSFASYHLWLDWRKTGYHLARVFTDYEPGIHYSQLQMQSGVTGINTLRIYSPVKQSKEHDPEGVFIRQWLPELSKVPNSWIHEPWRMPENLQRQYACVIGEDYPAPVVDHEAAIKYARAKIAEVRGGDGFRNESQKTYQKLGSRRKKRTSRKSVEKDERQMSLDF